MQNSFSIEPFEKIKDFDFTKFSQQDWNDFVQSISSYFQKYRDIGNPHKVDLCVFNGEPMVVLTFEARTNGRKNVTHTISLTAFEAELNFTRNSYITNKWRKFMIKKFNQLYSDKLDEHIDAKELKV